MSNFINNYSKKNILPFKIPISIDSNLYSEHESLHYDLIEEFNNDFYYKKNNYIQNNINLSVRTLLESVCQFTNLKNKPYIFILDDLHWIDKMSLDLLVFLVSTFDLKSKNQNKSTQISCHQIIF